MSHIKHLVSIEDISNTETITGLLKEAIFFAQNLDSSFHLFNNTFMGSLYMEPSTRTKFSFNIAASRLGIDILDFNAKKLSLSKGETFLDTLTTFSLMGVKACIVRTDSDKILLDHQAKSPLSLINAGSGITSHPSQALLDLLTIYLHFGKIQSLKLAIIGDVKHSRVANSNIDLHLFLQNKIYLVAPPYFQSPRNDHGIVHTDIDTALGEADIIMMLRIQNERHKSKIDHENYLDKYGMTAQRLKKINKNSIVLHPGPFNRNVEIDPAILNKTQVKIFDQVKNSIPMRMAILNYILNSK